MPGTRLIAEPGKQEIIAMRSFDAPRELVFKAFTDPEFIPQWWRPRIFKTVVDKMDVRTGGIWRFIQHDEDGSEYAFNGIYHEINHPDRLVYTFEYEGMPGHIVLETITIEEKGGETIVTNRSVFLSVADRDGVLFSALHGGSFEALELLSEFLIEVKANYRQ